MTNTKGPIRLIGLVFAVHPTARGFAWVLFESATMPVAWSIVHAGAGRNEHLVSRLARLLERYEPTVFVLESFEGPGTQRAPRIQRLCRSMERKARSKAIETTIFDRDAVQLAFAKFGVRTRTDIAHVIAQQVDAFSHRLPRKRVLGNSEDVRQSLFDAAALALTYFAYRGDPE